MGQFISLKSADGFEFSAYQALPTDPFGGPPKGGIVLLQEIFGVNSHIRAVADGYAAEGYQVLAPATFARVQAGVELGYSEADMQAGFGLKTAVEASPPPGVMADIQAAVDHLQQAGKVAVLGYCWGGLLCWRAACSLRGLAAAVPYYGGGMTSPNEASVQPMVPVLAHFAEQDHWIPLDTVAAFEQSQPGTVVHRYPGDHGFNCDHRSSYNAAAAGLARTRTLAFLAQHLG